MNELIKIESREIAGASVQTVNARELWTFVESKQDFSDWIKARIDKFGFIEGEDYLVHKFMVNPKGGRPTLDYHLTVDMGKELAMVENNDKGREVRRYFIECEKQAKAAPIQHLIPQTLSEALRLSADLADQRDQARAQSTKDKEALALQSAVVAEQAPMVQGFERLALAEGMVNGTMAAKLMQMSPHKFFAWLQELGWIRRPVGGKSWVGYQEHVNSGLITHKVYTKTLDDGTERNFPQVMVTSKGLAKLALKLGIDMTKGIFNEYANHSAQPNTPSQLCL